MLREIKKVVGGRRAVDGAGVRLVRVLGHDDTTDFDPFLMLDAFDSTDPDDYTKGFPWHPHRGIETVTYLISGDIEHGDSLGNSGSILDGDCQWMTAGSGIIHQEMPKASKRMLGAQLWLNLPAENKMTEPAYGDILSSDIPKIESNGCTVRVLSGNYDNINGAFEARYVKATYLDVTLEPGVEWSFTNSEEENLFIYIFNGEAAFGSDIDEAGNDKMTEARQAVLFTTGSLFRARAGEDGIRFILLSARPLKEPIAWGGPIVMNTRQELNQAFQELEAGTFIKQR